MSQKKTAILRRAAYSLLGVALLTVTLSRSASGQNDTAQIVHESITDGLDYKVYDRTGRATTLAAIVDEAIGAEVLLVGEEHDDMVGHSFQTLLLLEVVKRIGSDSGSGRTVVLSLEMFERDVQYVIDEYLAELITEAHFLRSSRPWEDYDERYRPLVESARKFGLPVLAANAPRRYVNRVTNQGPGSLTELSEQARSYLPPLPYRSPSDRYRVQWDALMAEAMLGTHSDSDTIPIMADSLVANEDDWAEDEGNETQVVGDPVTSRYEPNSNMIQAQALWDATMAHSITKALVEHIGGFVLHMAGSFHVAQGTGIQEHILEYRPGTRVTTVVMTKVDDITAWSDSKYAPLADYVVLTKKFRD